MHATTGSAGATRSLRRVIITLIAAAAVSLGFAQAPAQAAQPATRGLFGPQDPTYDGVDRQSTAILGLIATRTPVPAAARTWLMRQQCADGSFTAYRADPAAPCPEPSVDTFTGPNTNSTALAAMALRALAAGSDGPKVKKAARHAAQRAIAWLLAQQQADGGWEWLRGLGADSTSTAMVLTAIGKGRFAAYARGAAWLETSMPAGANCGVSFTRDSPIVDPLSTAWALLGAQGTLPYPPSPGNRSPVACSGAGTDILATGSWVAAALIEGDGQIPSAFDPGQTDWNVTAIGTLGMSQPYGSTAAMQLGLAALKENVTAYVVKDDVDRVAPLGTLLMLAHATTSNPRDFGGVDLTRRLLLTIQK